jgi:hypothetical protein
MGARAAVHDDPAGFFNWREKTRKELRLAARFSEGLD